MTQEQLLINQVTSDLPIKAYPERELLPRIREHFADMDSTLKTELEIYSMLDMGDAGGIVCEVRIIGMDTEKIKEILLTFITHLKIKSGEPHYQELETYRLKRIRKLIRQQRKNRFF